MNVQPINDLLLIRRTQVEQPKTASGILLPPVEESADTPWQGVVVAAGPGKPAKLSGAGQGVVDALAGLLQAFHATPDADQGRRGISLAHWQRAADAIDDHAGAVARVPMQVKVGDTVIFSRNGYQEFKINGETLVAMGEASIMGVLEQGVENV